MVDFLKPMAEWSAAIIEAIGVALIVVLASYAVLRGLVQLIRRENTSTTFQEVRQHLGQGILLGLEFLVAADIIHTVAVELTLETVGVLAIIVLIRTFLSFTIEVELSGKWPWQKKQ